MTIQEFKKFLKNQQKILDKKFPIPDKEKAVFARMTKITEELGELSNAVLSFFSLQRKQKKKEGIKEISNEIADVVIGTLLLTEQFNIDIEKCLEEKINKIKKRKY